MGTFTEGCLIKNHVDREKSVRIPHLLVDTGSEATWIPRRLPGKADKPLEFAGVIIQGRGGPAPRVPGRRKTRKEGGTG